MQLRWRVFWAYRASPCNDIAASYLRIVEEIVCVVVMTARCFFFFFDFSPSYGIGVADSVREAQRAIAITFDKQVLMFFIF